MRTLDTQKRYISVSSYDRSVIRCLECLTIVPKMRTCVYNVLCVQMCLVPMFLVHSHAHTIFPIACECISILSALPCLVFSTCSKRSNNKTFRLMPREQERLIEFTAKILDRRLSTKESNTRVWVDPLCVCPSKHAQAYKYFWEREIVIDVSFIAASCYGKVRVRVRVFCSLRARNL